MTVIGTERGFSLIELIVAVAILSILMGFTAVTLLRSNTVGDLDSQVNKMESILNLARKKAVSCGNQWIFEIDLNSQTYVIANDDGWLGTLSAPNAAQEPRTYYTGNPDFDAAKRNNGIIDLNELYSGPHALSSGVQFVDEPSKNMESDLKMVFNTRGGLANAQEFWIVDRNYPRPFPVTPTHDQRLHRRKISIFTAGIIKIGF